ncbi:unnamed protein product [Effrenium voratum]|nr:unnamed protein product [Effrenium voratum]
MYQIGYDVNQSGLLEPMELCRALRELGFAFDAFEVANWIEAVDTTGNHCADYAEFLAFCKLQVDALLGTGHVPKAALAADATPLVVDRRPSLPKEEQPAPQESANPATEAPPALPELHRHTSEIVRPDEIEEESCWSAEPNRSARMRRRPAPRQRWKKRLKFWWRKSWE